MKRIHLPAYDETACSLFALGRNAMYAALRLMGLEAGDEVLTPAFDCDGSLQPFRVLGLTPRFFRSDPYTFMIDLEDIKRKLTPRTKLIHIVNHFGMPQPWDDILKLRDAVGVPVMEDNAYSLFSLLNGRPFGTFGDVSIFSLRKNLPLVDGGMLRVNNPKYGHWQSRERSRWIYPPEAFDAIRILKDTLVPRPLAWSLNRIAKRTYPAAEPPVPLYSEKEYIAPIWPLRDKIGKEFSCGYTRPISNLAKQQLIAYSSPDLMKIADGKRAGYSYLAGRLSGVKGLTLLWPIIPEGIVPFCLTVLVSGKRDAVFLELRRDFKVMAWPTLPQAVIDDIKDFPEVALLGRKALQLNLPANMVVHNYFSKYLKGLADRVAAIA